MRRGAWWLFAVTLALGAFFFRYPKVAERPMHTDEAVHAVKLGILMETGEYEYNPHEYHGPLIYYAAMPFVWASGAGTLTELEDSAPLRTSVVVFGALLVLATALAASNIGRLEAGFAALLLAVSPAFGFYSRYFIQEVPFVFFCFVGLAAAWKMLETGKIAWSLAMGISIGMAVALKETWMMIVGTAALSAWLLHLTSPRHPWPRPFPWVRYVGLFALGIATAIFTGLFILSNFFRNPAAIGDTLVAVSRYVSRGVSGDSSTFGANVHNYPWHYYLQLLGWPDVDGPWLWTEGITLVLGCFGILAVVFHWPRARGAWHFIVIFTILLSAFYSAIPYKTPWNVLPMFLGWTLLAGRGFAALVRLAAPMSHPDYDAARRRDPGHHHKLPLIDPMPGPHQWTPARRFIGAGIAIILLAWPAALAVQSYRATIKRPADIRNPYAYSATSTNVRRLADRAAQIAALTPEGNDMVIQIVSPANDYWPLPWYLRQFPQIGYYTDFSQAHPSAAMILTAVDPTDEQLESVGPRQREFYGLRDEVVMTNLIRQDLWDKFIEQQMAK